MDLIRINQEKIKILLTKEDMEEYGLAEDSLDYGNPETRSAIRKLLETARQTKGFDALKERVFIQVFPGLKEGCEIYVTLLNDKKTEKGRKNRFHLYRFSDDGLLSDALRALSVQGGTGRVSLFALNGVFYLYTEDARDTSSAFFPGSLLSEYGEEQFGAALTAYVKEHGLCLFSSLPPEQTETHFSFG
ncbi:MAG: adaptor protein MecA [Clostridia bacterium]|nr:adaptor protein MecA [Clostridia bacterium]